MPKNIVIYSDGTGQDGGVRPEQRMSNIFKMYRATRSGPDSDVDPREQVVFYDPGLGTDAGATGLTSLRRGFTKLLSSVTGRGITTNIADCYEFIINHYRPGDRIWLFGFSRGAYTARSVATLLRLCGVPTKGLGGDLPRFRLGVREIAEKAVIRVAEHGAGHPRAKYEEEREELARRFRIDHGSDLDGEANAAPYFIGVFDTVASLGAKGPFRIVLGGLLTLFVLSAAAAIATLAHKLIAIGWITSFLVAAAISATFAAWFYLRTSLKVFTPSTAPWRKTFHLAQWSGRDYDKLLGKAVVYARHAIAIDENRADFPRVPWGPAPCVERRPEVEGEPKPFVQYWFAGNHSDIGGSYPEAESRLSDITLGWMLEEARSVPNPLIVDDARIRIFPDPDGVQHDEIAGMRDTVRQRTPTWLRWLTRSITWKQSPRDPKINATMHPSVTERFAAASVPWQGGDGPYRPPVLREHELFRHFYR
ncbi:MAG: phospholipase effector Tle1 domain-containing protein [Sphingobium sp.]